MARAARTKAVVSMIISFRGLGRFRMGSLAEIQREHLRYKDRGKRESDNRERMKITHRTLPFVM